MSPLEPSGSPDHQPSLPEPLSQRAAALRELTDRLEQAVTQIHDSDAFRRYLDSQARFHRYSFGNVLLILAQQPNATRVAGYRAWQSLNRYVRRGERAIRILVPMSRRVEQEQPPTDGDPDSDPARRSRLFFGIGHVFDISQTEGEPLPTIEVPVLQGDEGADLYRHLARLAADEALTLCHTDALPGQAMGVYYPAAKSITLRRSAQRQMTKTLAHELGHHFARASESSPEEETVAESIAYVVCARFGLDTGERSFPYVAIWSQEPRLFRSALGRIQTISAHMIERVSPGEAAEPGG